MKTLSSLLLILILLASCNLKQRGQNQVPIAGTWRLLNGKLIEKGDTMTTDYTQGVSFIKIINNNSFAFLEHDLSQGKDSNAVFVAGGGGYTLSGNSYTEHLEYCSDRTWEGNDFPFEISVRNDTLVIKGVEKVAEAGVDRVNIETYVRVGKE